MGDDTGIEWTDATWNPIVGCSIVSPGCTNCYAMKMAARLEAMAVADKSRWTEPRSGEERLAHYLGTTRRVNGTAVWTGEVSLAPDRIMTQPLRWKRPRRIFVNSMGDLFHEDVPDEWIDRVFAVMACAPQHTFQVLTKRSARMRAWFELNDDGDDRLVKVAQAAGRLMEDGDTALDVTMTGPWPLPNVWLGVSAERQQEADERIPDLLATPAAVRFVSAEPLLGEIDLADITWPKDRPSFPVTDDISEARTALRVVEGVRLDWVIAGGESGPDARPMHPDWARSLRDQCAAAGVPFFFKQWGEWEVLWDRDRDDPDWRTDYTLNLAEGRERRWLNLDGGRGFHGYRFVVMSRVGKRRAGRMLDGRTHDGMPVT